jgi:hypothetical protein
VRHILRDRTYLLGLAVITGVLAFSLAFGGGSSSGTPQHEVESPSATATVSSPSPTATLSVPPTPTLTQLLLDSKRAFDLARDATALELYRRRSGSYPSSNSEFTHFCTLAFDPGCQLLSVTTDFTGGDAIHPFWYRSDGKTYTIFAQAEGAVADNNCPPELPPALTDVPVLCVGGGGAR